MSNDSLRKHSILFAMWSFSPKFHLVINHREPQELWEPSGYFDALGLKCPSSLSSDPPSPNLVCPHLLVPWLLWPSKVKDRQALSAELVSWGVSYPSEGEKHWLCRTGLTCIFIFYIDYPRTSHSEVEGEQREERDAWSFPLIKEEQIICSMHQQILWM